LDLASPSERLPSHWTPLGIRLSWDSFSSVPRHRHTVCASTPRHCCQRRSAQPSSDDRVTVRPGGFSPLRRLTPRRGLGFIAPQSRPGFIAFHAGYPIFQPTEVNVWMEAIHRSAQCGSHPSKNSPRQQPYCVTAAVAPVLFGSHRRPFQRRNAVATSIRADKPAPPSLRAPYRSTERVSMTAPFVR